jgi:hypothetical protein
MTTTTHDKQCTCCRAWKPMREVKYDKDRYEYVCIDCWLDEEYQRSLEEMHESAFGD